MSAIDQAFLRAYHDDAGAKAAVALPTAKRRSATGAAPAWSGLSPASSDAAVGIESTSTSASKPLLRNADRRPLSEFARRAPVVEPPFKPALEVDRFGWSPICERLVRDYSDCLDSLVQTLMAADDAGRSIIGIAGAIRGVGCTTLAACAARLLVAAGKTIALVDGHFMAPGLARQLGLTVQTGWEDVLSGGAPLGEAVIHSLADQLVVLPLVSGGVAAAEKLDSIHASVTAGVLRYHYDIVLVDLGAITDAAQGAIARRIARQCRLDGVVIVSEADSMAAQPAHLMQSAPELAAHCLGVVEAEFRAAE
jgi:Mrp family chromosome partitioning ATPase